MSPPCLLAQSGTCVPEPRRVTPRRRGASPSRDQLDPLVRFGTAPLRRLWVPFSLVHADADYQYVLMGQLRGAVEALTSFDSRYGMEVLGILSLASPVLKSSYSDSRVALY